MTIKEQIKKTFTDKQIKDGLKFIDEAYKNKIPLGELRAYIETK